MARNTRVRIDDENQAADEQPGTPGGSPGVYVDESKQPVQDHGPSTVERPVAKGPTGRKFRVVRGPEMVMYAGSKTRLHVGRIMGEVSCDLDLLRRQGVVFEEVVEPASGG